MLHLKSRLLPLAVGAMVCVVAASGAEASSRHIKKHHQRMGHHYGASYGFNDVGRIAPVAPSTRRSVCPGMGRSFDCAVWPPPFDEDPDRKVSGSDGGG